jgi:four helix bundle protein
MGEEETPMRHENLKNRTRQFALAIIAFVESLPKNRTCDVLGRQLLRSGTSVGANYRSACRARSAAGFISKLGIVEEEADEAGYWTELLEASGEVSGPQAVAIRCEADELCTIIVASIRTARRNAAGDGRHPRSGDSALRTPHSEFE